MKKVFFLKPRRSCRPLAGRQGMTVAELMVSLCVICVLSALAIPFYINYLQQGRVISLILPRLNMIESNISIFYHLNNRLPRGEDINELLKDLDTDSLEIVISNGSIVMTIKAPDPASKLNILDNKVLVASPVVASSRIVSWHLAGELADRLKIDH